MGKNDKILIQWISRDKWNGVKQKVKRSDIKPAYETLRSGQEVQLKSSGRWFKVVVCENWSPKTVKGKLRRQGSTLFYAKFSPVILCQKINSRKSLLGLKKPSVLRWRYDVGLHWPGYSKFAKL